MSIQARQPDVLYKYAETEGDRDAERREQDIEPDMDDIVVNDCRVARLAGSVTGTFRSVPDSYYT